MNPLFSNRIPYMHRCYSKIKQLFLRDYWYYMFDFKSYYLKKVWLVLGVHLLSHYICILTSIFYGNLEWFYNLGLSRDLILGPLIPEARIIPLYHLATHLDFIVHQICTGFSNYLIWGSHGVMVSTLDFESSDPSSNLGGT